MVSSAVESIVFLLTSILHFSIRGAQVLMGCAQEMSRYWCLAGHMPLLQPICFGGEQR